MSGWTMGVVDLGLAFLPILAWAIWELWSLRRDKRREAESAARAVERPVPQGSGHAEGQHGADDGGPQTP